MRNNQQLTPVAIFASGKGSNAAKIIAHFQHHPSIKIQLIVSNKADAGVVAIAQANHIAYLIVEKEKFFRGDAYLPQFTRVGIQWIILAGFLWKLPVSLIRAFPDKIINIHPALLPKYGGKGMYGDFVHQAILDAREKESGITIHYVDEVYDQGKIIFQTACVVEEKDTITTLSAKVHALEHMHFPEVIEQVIMKGK